MQVSRFKFNISSFLVWSAGFVTSLFLLSALLGWWSYWRLEAKAQAVVSQWKIIKKSSSEYAIRASYTFEFQGKSYKGQTIFEKPYHLNRPSAERQIQKFTTYSWQAWIQPHHPEISSLQKTIPVKKSIYALMTVGIFFYFLFKLKTDSHTRQDRYQVE